MTPSQLRSHATPSEFVIILAIQLAFSAYAAFGQSVARVSADGTEYHAMAMQYNAGASTISAPAPFAFRVATPWLASKLDPVARAILPDEVERKIEDANGLKGFAGFYATNLIACVALTLLLHSYTSHFIHRRWLRVLVTGFWIAQWNAPVRFTFFYPAYVDPVFMVALFGGLLLVERANNAALARAAAAVSLLTFAGTLCRETAILIPGLFATKFWSVLRHSPRALERVVVIVPFLAYLMALLLTRVAATATGSYDTLGFALAMWREKPVFTWILAWFFAVGPATVALIAGQWRLTWPEVYSRPHWMFYLAACGVLGYFGSTDTERILTWAAPVVLVLAALALEHSLGALRRWPFLAVGLGLVSVASTRLLWHVPAGIDAVRPASELGPNWQSLYTVADRLLVIENFYTNLWSFYGSAIVHAVQLAFDVTLVVCVVLLLRSPSIGGTRP